MNNPWKDHGENNIGRNIIIDKQHAFQTDVSYLAAKRKAIELATVVDRYCKGWKICKYPHNVWSWNDDRRIPFVLGQK